MGRVITPKNEGCGFPMVNDAYEDVSCFFFNQGALVGYLVLSWRSYDRKPICFFDRILRLVAQSNNWGIAKFCQFTD